MANVGEIFGAAAAAPKKKIVQRTMLKNNDTVAAQALNPYGPSVVDTATLSNIYAAAAKG